MKSSVIIAAIGLSLIFVSIIAAVPCSPPSHWGPWHYFFGTHPTQAGAYENAYENADAWCAGYICDYSEEGCELIWQGSMRVWKCEVDARRCVYP